MSVDGLSIIEFNMNMYSILKIDVVSLSRQKAIEFNLRINESKININKYLNSKITAIYSEKPNRKE